MRVIFGHEPTARRDMEPSSGRGPEARGDALKATPKLQRSLMAFAPIRNMGTELYGAPRHNLGRRPLDFGRQTGGHGIGEITTPTVGSQFRPAAPDWSGQSVSYTLLVTDGSDTDVLDLFAHPPLVRVGERPQ